MNRTASSSQGKILIVDDEEFNRLLLSRVLERDYEVDFAVNGKQALEKLDSCDFDAVLLDVMMPVLDGISALKTLRETRDFASLPVILVSALRDTETIVEGLDLGANDYITKPIDPMIVRARIRTQIALKRATDERNAAIQLLEQANDMKVRMMQIASHDLKNPLHNLSLMLSLMDGTQIERDRLPNFVQIASESIETMVDIVDDFLGGQAFTGRESIRTDVIASQVLVNRVLAQYEIAARQKDITITASTDPTMIVADENRMMQVMSNLVSNAIKYSPKHSTVTIRAMCDDTMWRFEVQDAGSGIPEDEQQHLFKAFSKNHISTQPTDGEHSTGLGLWIAAEMMRAQEGNIGMITPENGGCCFWLEIPIAVESMSIIA